MGNRIEWAARKDPPSVALHLVSTTPDTTLAGQTGLVEHRVQVDCWADTFLNAKQIGNAVIAALPARGTIIDEVRFLAVNVIDIDRGRFAEPPQQLHRTRIDVRVSTNKAI